MDYLKLLNKLDKLQGFHKEVGSSLDHAIEYDEIPLISRIGREKPFLKIFPQESLSTFFLNTAVFYRNNIRIMASDITLQDDSFELYTYITYPSVEMDMDIFGCAIPHLCLMNKKYLANIYEEPLLDLNQNLWLKDALDKLQLYNSLKIVHELWTDQFGDEISRIHLLDKVSIL